MLFMPVVGDTVLLKDGKVLIVTDAVDQSAFEVITNPDDICRGVDENKHPWIFSAQEIDKVRYNHLWYLV